MCFTARQRGRSLAEAHIAQSNFHQSVQVARDTRDRREEFCGLGNGHIEDVSDALSLVQNLQRFAVVASAVADFAGNVDIRKEVHLDLESTVSLAGFAATSLDVERKAPRTVTAQLRFRDLSKEFADLIPHTCIGSGVRARRTADRRLINMHDFIELIGSSNRAMPSWN